MANSPRSFHFALPVEIAFGPGALDELGGRCAAWGRRAFIVTGRHSSRINGSLAAVQRQLPDAVVYDAVEENPGTETCDKAAQICRDAGCGVVIGLGGGSPIDVAKAVAGLALNPGPCSHYFGAETFTEGLLPVVAIPTTAGAGSEVTPYSVIVDAGSGEKRSIAGRGLFPQLALLDPELTRTMPPGVTAHTGLDALSQAMEGMVSNKRTPVGDLFALESVRLIRRALPRAVHNGGDADARTDMLYAALLSGCIVAQSGTTLVHGMGYPLTTEWGIAHGLANALLLPPLFRHNAQCMPDTVALIAEALGKPCTADDAAHAVSDALYGLMDELGLSSAGADHGFDRTRLDEFARMIASNPYRFRNQPGEIDEARVRSFYEEAYRGEAVLSK